MSINVKIWLEHFSIECRKTKTKVITTANQNKDKYHKEPMRTQSKYMKSGKTRVTKSRLVLVLLLIGWEGGVKFTDQSESVVKQNQCNPGILSTLSWKLL